MGGTAVAVERHAGNTGTAGRIGPNAVIRLAEALRAQQGIERTEQIFSVAGHGGWLHELPQAMVDERVVTDLHAALRGALDPADAARVATHAGELTADYLLANRIPRPVQALLRASPASWAARLLVSAIRRHSWTFAGSGTFTATFGGHAGGVRLRLAIAGCPICRGARCPAPTCDYYAATFERLFRELVRSSATVRETACQALGSPECVFDARW